MFFIGNSVFKTLMGVIQRIVIDAREFLGRFFMLQLLELVERPGQRLCTLD